MAEINIFDIQPNVVSKDLSSYTTYIYGKEKVGKTTFASQTPKPLILAFEIGYKALPGVMAQPINSWGDVKKIVRQLKDPKAHDLFQTIVFDTIDEASMKCEKYICQQNDVESIGQVPYGNGWTQLKREWTDTINTIKYLGYAVMFISHCKDKTFKKENGTEYNQVIQTCSNSFNEIAKNQSDIIGYADVDEDTGERFLILRSLDNKVSAGCRFRDIAPRVPFSYDALIKAMSTAIDNEAAETNNKFTTEDRVVVLEEAPTYDFEALTQEFQKVVGHLITKDKAKYAPKITEITNKILGRGKKAVDLKPEQAELLSIIIDEINALD